MCWGTYFSESGNHRFINPLKDLSHGSLIDQQITSCTFTSLENSIQREFNNVFEKIWKDWKPWVNWQDWKEWQGWKDWRENQVTKKVTDMIGMKADCIFAIHVCGLSDLLETGINASRATIDDRNTHNDTVLGLAYEYCNLRVARMLLDAKADINNLIYDKKRPLQCMNGHLELVRSLI